ncbi:MAG: type II toxin-antitoxin system VapB family antitoxin [Jatrophihabitantaceae bacterium]
MRTNIVLDDDLLQQAAAILGTRTKKSTVEAAFRELIRRNAMRELAEMRGKVGIEDISVVRPDWEPSRRTAKAPGKPRKKKAS